ncbi:hypothetical protein MMC13_006439 [Lambiella insularis]|nr:hypothetical protein [Lambiella insularis]
MTESTEHPLSGLWAPTHLKKLYYGPSSVEKHLISCLPKELSKAFIITGSSLATKTPLIKEVEDLLTKKHHAGTFSKIQQHAPVQQLDEATEAVHRDPAIDTIISIGGGSPIDSAKAISHRSHEKSGKYLYHISVPTTLSAAECSFVAGFAKEDGVKTGMNNPEVAVDVIIYDAKFALQTPQKLWLSTGLRAMDHAVELLYHPTSTEVPTRQLILTAAATLFEYLPKSKAEPKNEDHITRLQLAAWSSLYPFGLNVKGGLGLSHALGYALGSPYSIPHGITSCLTLASVVRLKADNAVNAAQIARILPFIGQSRSNDVHQDALKVADAIDGLVQELGLATTISDYGVGEDQVPKISKMATGGQDEGELYSKVKVLVHGLL